MTNLNLEEELLQEQFQENEADMEVCGGSN